MGIKNLVITPVIIGRISIGERVESNGKQLPKKSDEFHITSNQQENGQWVVPKSIEEARSHDGKLKKIPVRVMFDTPENNFRAGYACFNNEGRQVCAGDGETAARMSPQGRQDVECPGHEACKFGQANRCKPYARLLISLESMYEKDPLAAFAFRTTGYNSVNALTSRLTQFAALTGGNLSGMACNLVLRPKSTAKSRRQAIYYVDLEPRGSLFDAVASTVEWHKQCADRGINLEALDKAVAAGFAAVPYIDTDETMQEEDVAGEFHNSEQVQEQPQEQAMQPMEEDVVRPNPLSVVPTEPSAALQEKLKKIATMSSTNQESACLAWVKNCKVLSEYEKGVATQAITDKVEELAQAEQQQQAA